MFFPSWIGAVPVGGFFNSQYELKKKYAIINDE